MSTIKLRAIAQIGKISRELEKARFVMLQAKTCVPSGGKSEERASSPSRHLDQHSKPIRGTRGARSCSPRLEELAGHLAAFKGLLWASRLP